MSLVCMFVYPTVTLTIFFIHHRSDLRYLLTLLLQYHCLHIHSASVVSPCYCLHTQSATTVSPVTVCTHRVGLLCTPLLQLVHTECSYCIPLYCWHTQSVTTIFPFYCLHTDCNHCTPCYCLHTDCYYCVLPVLFAHTGCTTVKTPPPPTPWSYCLHPTVSPVSVCTHSAVTVSCFCLHTHTHTHSVTTVSPC